MTYILLIITLVQPNAARRVVAGIFCCITLSHDIYLSHLDGFLYYGSAAFFDLVIILLLAALYAPCDMILKLQKVCLVSILVNLIGWVCWYLYLPPVVYNVAFLLIYLHVLVILSHDLGDTTVGSRYSGICGYTPTGYHSSH